jgi:hypothetical protein
LRTLRTKSFGKGSFSALSIGDFVINNYQCPSLSKLTALVACLPFPDSYRILPHIAEINIYNKAFGLAIGFSALFFSPLRLHMQAASVMWVAMAVSSIAALLLVPIFFSRRKRKNAPSP